MFLSIGGDGRWAPGIGDPTVMGWLTVAAYLGTAWLCARAAGRTPGGGPRARHARRLWYGLAFLLLALGINKQLDLQSLLTEVGRDLALAQGWYEARGQVQRLFIGALAAAGALLLAVSAWLLRWQDSRLQLAWGGLLLLTVFVLARASSFHHMDRLIGLELGGIRMNWVLELGGIGLVAAGAGHFLRRPR